MMRFEDAVIEAEAAGMPSDLREPYVWLKTYLRDQCGRDLGELVRRFNEVGVTTDKTNWGKILKGRWRLDASGNECVPCVAADKLLRSIRALQTETRVELLEGRTPFVETSVFHTIRRFIEKKMRPDRVNRFGVIVGPTGTQKTASYKEMAQRNRFVKWLESPHNGSIMEFVARLGQRFGVTGSSGYSVVTRKLHANVTPEHCIIVDNVQNMVRSRKELLRLGKAGETQPAYQFMRDLQDERGCSFIWSITPEDEDQMFDSRSIYYEQFEGRAGGKDGFLRLANYPPHKDLVLIAKTLGMRDAEKHGDLLSELARQRGRIRRFFEILQEAKFAADADGKALTMDYVLAELEERGVTLKGG
ncbi:MAG TPA: ATP-binding protein [Kiritimatiellia bacterium]|nr:ATP-binding protein [Kiritimatiellia bacterium]